MAEIKVLTLVGGISKGSLNQKLFRVIQELAKPEMNLQSFDISTLPFFSQDLESDPPQNVVEFWNQLENSAGVLFVTPEYNKSIPGVLKNAIDWGSRPPKKNRWKNKPVVMMGASSGNIGTFSAQQHLRTILSPLQVRMMQQPEFYMNGSKAIDEQGQITDPGQIKFVKMFVDSMAEWFATHPV